MASVAERAFRRISINNIPFEATEEMVLEIFSRAGPVVEFNLELDEITKASRGCGVVEYEDAETALAAMRNLRGADCLGRPLRMTLVDEQGATGTLDGLRAAVASVAAKKPSTVRPVVSVAPQASERKRSPRRSPRRRQSPQRKRGVEEVLGALPDAVCRAIVADAQRMAKDENQGAVLKALMRANPQLAQGVHLAVLRVAAAQTSGGH